mgnify:FL=1
MSTSGVKFSDFPAANPALPIDLMGLQDGINVRTTLINPVCEDANGGITVVTVEATEVVAIDVHATNIIADDVTTSNIVTSRIETATEIVVRRDTDAPGVDHVLLHTGNLSQFHLGGIPWTQTIPLSTWTVSHNLGRFPSVTVVDVSGSKVEPDVTYIDENIIQITHGVPMSGMAYLN